MPSYTMAQMREMLADSNLDALRLVQDAQWQELQAIYQDNPSLRLIRGDGLHLIGGEHNPFDKEDWIAVVAAKDAGKGDVFALHSRAVKAHNDGIDIVIPKDIGWSVATAALGSVVAAVALTLAVPIIPMIFGYSALAAACYLGWKLPSANFIPDNPKKLMKEIKQITESAKSDPALANKRQELAIAYDNINDIEGQLRGVRQQIMAEESRDSRRANLIRRSLALETIDPDAFIPLPDNLDPKKPESLNKIGQIFTLLEGHYQAAAGKRQGNLPQARL